MPIERRAIFLFDLLQDVNILNPLVELVAHNIAAPIDLMVSWSFRTRDTGGDWYKELERLAEANGASLFVFNSELEAWKRLSGQTGMIVSASESNLSTHRLNHSIFRMAPASMLRVTVQHGFECVGFRHSKAHDASHGAHVVFAADVVCGWGEPASLHSLALSERSKLLVTGIPSVLNSRKDENRSRSEPLVCENLHSVRLRAAWGLQTEFMETLFGFADRLGSQGRTVKLRPHPAGQYVTKNNIALPGNVSLDQRPAYALDFGHYAHGISAPSSVIVDMVLAGMPVAVWQDASNVIDISNYKSLPVISGIQDWLDFDAQAVREPASFAAGRSEFLAGAGLLTDRAEVEKRFLRLFSSVLPRQSGGRPVAVPSLSGKIENRPLRILFVANGPLPTLDLYFILPLAQLVDDGKVVWTTITESQLVAENGSLATGNAGWLNMRRRFLGAEPDVVVFCRYSGPHAAALLDLAHQHDVPCMLHLDDDMLNVPRELGEAKFNFHNHPDRLAAIRNLLNGCDLVFCSTPVLRDRFADMGFRTPMLVEPIAVGMDILRPAVLRPVRKLGYMGFDHEKDFEIALPAVIRYLRQHPDVTLELFGRIPRGARLEEFGSRVVVIPPIHGYLDFRAAFAAREWDIGICPLEDIPFNARKSDLKWVEYTSVGAAVVATSGTIYDKCGSDGCARLCDDEESWFRALDELTRDPKARFALVERAQKRLAQEYSLDHMRGQVLGALRATMVARMGKNTPPTPLS
jgi:glycosyltransferase involved in cell wall biosynthesis